MIFRTSIRFSKMKAAHIVQFFCFGETFLCPYKVLITKGYIKKPACLYWGLTMEEYIIQQKIQDVYIEPRAPLELVSAVVLRAKAVAMGVQAQKQLETAPADQVSILAARALIGQLAAVSVLPAGSQPEQLAQQLQQEPAFVAALRGGNVLRRIQSGELLRQMSNKPPNSQAEVEAPKIEGPIL